MGVIKYGRQEHPVTFREASSVVSVGSRSVAIVVSPLPRRLLYGASLGVIFLRDRTP